MKMRQPTTDGGAILTILSAELLREPTLLKEHDKYVEADADKDGVKKHSHCLEQDSPAKNYREHANVHRISHVPVQSTDDKAPWCIDWCRRTAAERGEIPDAPHVNTTADRQQDNRKEKYRTRCHRAVPNKIQRYIDAHCSGDYQRKQEVLQKQNHGEA
jgi:hypothetical protein